MHMHEIHKYAFNTIQMQKQMLKQNLTFNLMIFSQVYPVTLTF